MLQIIGIDVSKAKLDCLWLRDVETLKIKTKVIKNTKAGIEMLGNWLVKTTATEAKNILVVMEATGIYHEALAYYLHKKGFRVSVVNPAKIKAFGKSLGNVHKTDKQDSFVIARFGAMQKPDLWQPEPKEIRELKSLNARLEGLEKDLQRENNRHEKFEISNSSKVAVESIKIMIKEITKEKKRIEQKIDDHIDRHPRLKNDRKLLESIVGIGPVLSRIMLAVIHSRSFTSAKQLAAYLGLIPMIVESGVFKGRSKLSKNGPASVRAKLYMATVSASIHNLDIRRQRERLLANGKCKMQALGAGMRKLVHICFGVIKSQTEYSPQVI